MKSTIEQLIAASSFGTPEAMDIRRGGTRAAKRIRKADRIAAKKPGGHVCSRCKRWVDGFGFGCACS